MIIPIPLPTSTSIPTMYNPTGWSEPIRMEYEIRFDELGREKPGELFVDTTSFRQGVSLSSIKWSFYNICDQSTREGGVIEFTVHDIAGQTLEKYYKISRTRTHIYFLGPMSDGSLWIPGKYAIYVPIEDKCSLEFSATQGFTYKIVGKPAGKIAESAFLTTPFKIIINGIGIDNKNHDNTFRSYLKEFEDKWNAMIKQHPSKESTAMIKFITNEKEGVNSMMMKATPYYTEQNKDTPLNPSGDPVTRIKEFEVSSGSPIAEYVRRLWQQRFTGKDPDDKKGTSGSSTLLVEYSKYEGGINYICIKLLRKQDSDEVNNVIPVCIGSDLNCIGQQYRATLSNIEFNGIFNSMQTNKINLELHQSNGEPGQVGNTENKTIPVKDEEGQFERSTTEDAKHSAGLPRGNNSLHDGWACFSSLLNDTNKPEFVLDIEMPYTFAFTPKQLGGLLENSIDDQQTSNIHEKVGVDLEFYWYTDPLCEILTKVEAISRKYRLDTVTHSIGLSGNSTQLRLSHMYVEPQ